MRDRVKLPPVFGSRGKQTGTHTHTHTLADRDICSPSKASLRRHLIIMTSAYLNADSVPLEAHSELRSRSVAVGYFRFQLSLKYFNIILNAYF